MKLLPIILCVFLIGCVEEEEPCNTKYSYSDTTGYAGLTLKYTSSSFVTFNKMEALYQEMEKCLGMSAPAPTIEFIDFAGGWGIYIVPSQTIWMNEDVGIAPRNCHSDRETLKHEFLHHILYMNGNDYRHGNKAFERCDAMGVNTCNGIPCDT